MADKTSVQCLEGILSKTELTLPTDYVLMKKNFKKELVTFYLASLGEGQRILDLNPGFEGLYGAIDISKIEYVCLEQNPKVRSFLEQNNISVFDWKIPVIPLQENTVDYILSTPFIEHLPSYLDAMSFLIEAKRVLKSEGRILIIVPNYLNLKAIFYEDYKHNWITTKKRITDMLKDLGFEVTDLRYTIGWITMRQNPGTSLLRFLFYCIMTVLRSYIVDRTLDFFKLSNLANKFKKTFFELIVIEAKINKETNYEA